MIKLNKARGAHIMAPGMQLWLGPSLDRERCVRLPQAVNVLDGVGRRPRPSLWTKTHSAISAFQWARAPWKSALTLPMGSASFMASGA